MKVEAVWTNPDGGADVTFTTTTDSSGVWSLIGIPSGAYKVSVDPTTLPYGITVPTGDRDGVATPHTAQLTLAGGQTISDVDFGYTGSGVVGDTIFLDADGDAFPDVDEGIPGVSVTLTWAGADASSPADDVVYATVTDQFGAYTFAGLPAGAFTIAVDTSSLPSGLTNAFDPDGGLANSASIILVTGERRLDVDFGYSGTNSLGDTVFADTNGNGIQDADEVGLGGVAVVLRRDIDGDGAFETTVGTTTTSGTGTYLFDQLPAGSYQVAVTVPSALTATTATSFDITLLDRDSDLSADFGLRSQPSAPGSIGDLVWNDTDANGILDGAETGVGGVTVTLRSDTDGDGVFETLVATQVSASNGAYGFENLPAGSYLVSVTPPDGKSVTTIVAYTVSLTAGATVDTADFGLSEATGATGWPASPSTCARTLTATASSRPRWHQPTPIPMAPTRSPISPPARTAQSSSGLMASQRRHRARSMSNWLRGSLPAAVRHRRFRFQRHNAGARRDRRPYLARQQRQRPPGSDGTRHQRRRRHPAQRYRRRRRLRDHGRDRYHRR